MNYTDVGICSKALSKLGVEGITSFEDGTAEAEIAVSLYELVKDSLISSYTWSFATMQKRLPRLVDEPVADYTYSYLLPNDYLRIISAGAGLKGKGLEYKVSSNKLHTNSSEVIITYICNVSEEDFPPFFCDALTTKLAAEFCLSLTDDSNKSNYLLKKAEDEIKAARLIDAQQSTPKKFEDFTLVEVRK